LLAVAVVLVIAVSSALDLEIESYALAGVLAGGVVALIPDRSAWARLGAFAVGFVAAWIGFVLRAAVLPDTEGGRAVAAIVTLLICVVAVAAGRTRLPLSAMLLGVVLFSAAYEAAFVAAEPEVASTSLDAATGLVCAVAVGFAVAVVASGRQPRAEGAETGGSGRSARTIRLRRTRLNGTAATNTEVTR
jgi:hypothetical protein